MKRAGRLLGLLPLVAAAMAMAAIPTIEPPPPDFAPGFASIAHTGFVTDKKARIDTWRLRRTRGHGAPIDLVMTLAPKHAARVQFAFVARRGPSRTLYERALCRTPLAMINGSFFDGVGKGEHVQGLLRINGRTLLPVSARKQGGFLTSDGYRLGVVPRLQLARAETAKNAIESSPILALAGANDMWRDDGVHANRAAAGVTDKGDVILIGAFGARDDAVSLYEFETLAEASVAADRLKLQELIAMDGGPSAHLYLPRAGLFYGQTGPIFLTDVICLSVE